MRFLCGSGRRRAAATALVVLIGSVLVGACAGGSDTDSGVADRGPEVDLTGLDVEMHYAVG